MKRLYILLFAIILSGSIVHAGCGDPVLDSIQVNPTTVCSGTNASVTIFGQLNDAAEWAIYDAGCGGGLRVSTNTNTISLPGGSYHIRGEGGCITPGVCDSFSIGIFLDVVAPVITCPGNQNDTYNTSGCRYTVPDFTGMASVSDSCDSSPSITQFPVSGTITSSDTVGITLYATDASANVDSCTFDVYLSAPAPSSSYTWTGYADTDWNNAANWMPCGVPSNGDDVIIDAGGSTAISINGGLNLGSLTVNAGAVLTLSNDLTVIGDVENNGTINSSLSIDFDIYGDFENNGLLDFSSVTLTMMNSGNLNLLNGNFTGSNTLSHIVFDNYIQTILLTDVQADSVSLNGLLNLGQNTLIINSSSPSSLNTGPIGYIIGEDEMSSVQWAIGSNTGTYTIPFGVFTGLIPFSFSVTTAGSGSGSFEVSTFPVADNNTPYPLGVTNMDMLESITDQSEYALDRFWQIDVNGFTVNPVADVTFSYFTDDLVHAASSIDERDLMAFRWNGSDWGDPIIGLLDDVNNTYTVNGISEFSPWTLAGPCKAEFTANTVCYGDMTTFVDSSLGSMYLWDFDVSDGVNNSAVAGNVGHEYSTPGTYTAQLIVGNNSGCVDTFSATVVVDTAATVSFEAEVACLGDTTFFTDNSTWLDAGSTYDWDFDNDGTYEVLGATPGDESFVYATAGSYTAKLRITNGSGCADSSTTTVTVLDIPPLPIVDNDTVCTGEPATFMATSGGSNGDFYWYSDAARTNLLFVGNPYITEAVASDTDIWVVETLGSCSSDTVHVRAIVRSSYPNPTTNSPDTVACGDPSQLIATTGGANGTFVWYTDSGANNQIFTGDTFWTDPITTNTSYWVQEGNSDGCMSSLVQVDVVVDAITDPTAINDTIACGDAATLLAVSGGSLGGSSVDFEWYTDNGGNNLVYTGNPYTTPSSNSPASYWIREVNAEGCATGLIEAMVLIDSMTNPTVNTDTVVCGDAATLLAVSGGSLGGSNVDFEWYTDSIGDNLVFTGNPYSTPIHTSDVSYWVREVNAEGCATGLVEAPIVVNPIPAPVLASNAPICEDEDLALTAPAGFAVYQWFNDSTGFTSNIQNPIVPNASLADSGTYNLMVYDLIGCVSDTGSIQIIVNPRPVLTNAPSNNGPLCELQTLELYADTVVNVLYDWTGPGTFVSTDQYPSIDSVLEVDHQGVYSVVLTDTLTGCVSNVDYSTFVDVIEIPQSVAATNNGPLCEDDEALLFASDVFTATYSWTGPNGFSSTDQNPVLPSITPADSGMYSVVITVDGCFSDTSSTLLVVHPKPIIQAYIDEDTIIQGSDVQLSASGGITYNWDPFTYLTTFDINNPWVVQPPIGEYTFTVTGFDEHDCFDTSSVDLTVIPNLELIVYEVITPNRDGYNDNWTIKYIENLTNYSIRVFDRGGEMVFQSFDYNNKWHGTRDGKDLPAGPYFYVIETATKTYKGGLTIIR